VEVNSWSVGSNKPLVITAVRVVNTKWEVFITSEDIYYLSAKNVTYNVVFYDKCGNKTSKTLTTPEPTIPYEPMLTDGFTGEQNLNELRGYQVAGKYNNKSGYMQTLAGEGQAIVYSGPSSLTDWGDIFPFEEYRVSGWISDEDTKLTGIKQYSVTYQYNYDDGEWNSTTNRRENKITKISSYNSFSTKNVVTYRGNSFKMCHWKGSNSYASRTNYSKGWNYLLGIKQDYVMVDPSFRLTNSAANRETIATKVLNEYFSH